MTDKLEQIPLSHIQKNPYQPRTIFKDQELADLAQSIKENGLIQPIIVRKSPLFGYDLIAGERRLRASQLAGLTHITAVVKDMSDQDSMKQAIIENLQREDLNPIDEALAYQQLIDRLKMTHEEIATSMGKSRPYISNSLRLLNLSEASQKALVDQVISPGHARLLLSCQDEAYWLQQILSQQLTVRQLEAKLKPKTKVLKNKDSFVAEQEELLKKKLGLPVQIQMNTQHQGKLVISFSNLDDFHNLIHSFLEPVDKM